MRIIAGEKRGLKLLSPGGLSSRPITDRVKESLFSILAGYGLPDNASVADFFCGVGSLGLEALSRGAGHVEFVERDPAMVRILRRNLSLAGFTQRARVRQADAWSSAKAASGCGLVFLDPPYPQTDQPDGCRRMAGLLEEIGRQVAEGAIVTARVRASAALPASCGELCQIENRRWGSMAVALYSRTAG